MADLSPREIDRLYEAIDHGFKGVHERLDALNGRTREAEKQIAVHETQIADLKHRPEPSPQHGRAVAYGAGTSAAIVAVAEAVKAWFK